MRALGIAVLLLSGVICTGADFKPFSGPNPVAVFIQTDPWAMVIGSDTPRVVFYEDGEVIFLKKVNQTFVYHHTTLDEAASAAFRQRLRPVLDFKKLKAFYNVVPNVTDQPEAMFYLRDGEHETATSVYGLKAADTRLPAWTQFPPERKADKLPDELLQLHTWLCALEFPKSEEWTPKYVEVMLWDYSYAPAASIKWPKDWPTLTSERALKRGASYSIFLDGALLPKLREFLATRKEKGAVELDGKKWAASYRFAFPGEPKWHKAFSKAAKE